MRRIRPQRRQRKPRQNSRDFPVYTTLADDVVEIENPDWLVGAD